MSPFRSKFKITQQFGVNVSYYSQFGLKGHEGIDLIPTGSVWDVLSLEDGVVVLDDDVVGSVSTDPYGKIVTVWHPSIKKATMYCHLSENFVSLGQIVKKGDRLGTMGSTGNSSGAHLHLNLFNVDDNGVRLNRNNGYLGGIDPLPFLESDSAIIAQPIAQNQPTEIPVPSDYQPMKQVITDVYRAICGVEPSEDEIKSRLNSKINTYDLIKDINSNDSRSDLYKTKRDYNGVLIQSKDLARQLNEEFEKNRLLNLTNTTLTQQLRKASEGSISSDLSTPTTSLGKWLYSLAKLVG